MFNFLKKEIVFHSPVIGKAVAIEEVPDPMFAKKMLGDGVAVEFTTDTLYAPCDAEVVMIAASKHALGFKVKEIEFLIHIGLDTVNYAGEGFEVLIREGEKVKRGQAIVKVDRDFFLDKGVNLITPIVITTPDVQLTHLPVGEVNLESELLKIG